VTVAAIIQARLGSTRLPGKVLLNLGGWPVVDWVIERVAAADLVDEVIIAIPEGSGDDRLAVHLARHGCHVVRGSAHDVLARFALAASETSADVIVRVTADCPLLDPETLDRVIASFREHPPVDYCSNTLIRTYPLGLDCEAVRKKALLTANAEATTKPDREHVTPFLYQRPQRFRLRSVEAPEWARRPVYRLTLDEPLDLGMLRRVMTMLRPSSPAELGIRRVIDLLDEDEELAAVNRAVLHRHVAKPDNW